MIYQWIVSGLQASPLVLPQQMGAPPLSSGVLAQALAEESFNGCPITLQILGACCCVRAVPEQAMLIIISTIALQACCAVGARFPDMHETDFWHLISTCARHQGLMHRSSTHTAATAEEFQIQQASWGQAHPAGSSSGPCSRSHSDSASKLGPILRRNHHAADLCTCCSPHPVPAPSLPAQMSRTSSPRTAPSPSAAR